MAEVQVRPGRVGGVQVDFAQEEIGEVVGEDRIVQCFGVQVDAQG